MTPRSTRIAGLLTMLLPMASQAQSLQQTVLAALAHYPAIVSSQYKTRAAQADITRAQGAHWPQLSWSGTYNDYQSSTLSDRWIQTPVLSLNLWSGGRIASDIERAKALSQASQLQEHLTRDEVALLSSEAYLQWAHHSHMTSLAEENLAAHEKILRDFQTISQVDSGRRIDLSQAQVRYENARIAVIRSQTDMRVSGERVSRMLMAPAPAAPSGLDSTPGVPFTTLDQARTRLNDQHPAIARLLAQCEAARASIRYAQAQSAPTVNLTHSKSVVPGLAQGQFVTQLQLNLPLCDGGSARGAVGVESANLQALQADLAEMRLLLQEQLSASWTSWQQSRIRADMGQAQVHTAQILARGYELQFRAGRRSLLDLLNIQSDLFTYQSNAATAAHEARLSQGRVLAHLGQLAQAYETATPRSASVKVTE